METSTEHINQALLSPEAELISAILNTFVEDLMTTKSEDRSKGLLIDARTEWIEFLCGLIEIDHAYFVERLEIITTDPRTWLNRKGKQLGRPETIPTQGN